MRIMPLAMSSLLCEPATWQVHMHDHICKIRLLSLAGNLVFCSPDMIAFTISCLFASSLSAAMLTTCLPSPTAFLACLHLWQLLLPCILFPAHAFIDVVLGRSGLLLFFWAPALADIFLPHHHARLIAAGRISCCQNNIAGIQLVIRFQTAGPVTWLGRALPVPSGKGRHCLARLIYSYLWHSRIPALYADAKWRTCAWQGPHSHCRRGSHSRSR